jgi:hypothetical protein
MVGAHRQLDRQVTQLRQIQRIEVQSVASVVECHSFLASVLIDGINEWRSTNSDRDVQARDSFISKYLHFHAPMAFFILDSLARTALKANGMRNWRVRWPNDFGTELRTPYASFCFRMLSYIDLSYLGPWWTPRMVDGHLLGYLPSEAFDGARRNQQHP